MQKRRGLFAPHRLQIPVANRQIRVLVMRLLQFDRVHGAIRFIFVLLFGLCAACAQPPTLATTPDPEAARFALANGSNSIEGHASLTLQSGDVHTCKLDGVSLVPATSFTTELMNSLFGNPNAGYSKEQAYGRLPASDDVNIYTRHVECDESGHFRFQHVASGRYFVVSNITWSERWAHDGGALMQSVEVKTNEHRALALDSTLPY